MSFEEPADPASASALSPEESWTAADRTADLYRYQRQHPTKRHLLADRWLPPVLVVLVSAESVTMVASLAAPVDLRVDLQLGATAATFLTLVLALIWGFWTDRMSFSGASSIRSALPAGAWPSIRQQLAGRAPTDTDHLETIVELAHQRRSGQRGQLGLFSWYLPLVIHLGATAAVPSARVLLVIGTIGIGSAVASVVLESRHLTRFLRQHGVPA